MSDRSFMDIPHQYRGPFYAENHAYETRIKPADKKENKLDKRKKKRGL